MDHKSLISLLGSMDLSDLPLRIQRFKMRLMRYDSEMFHMLGSKMFIADLLSRPPVERETDRIAWVDMHVGSSLAAEEDVLVEGIRQQAVLDSDYQLVVKAIWEGWPKRVKSEMK